MNNLFRILATLLFLQVTYVFTWDRPRQASPGQFPHQALLLWIGQPPIPNFHRCGGAILNRFWILSSAYCIVNIPDINLVIVKVGSHNISQDDEYVQTSKVETVIVHKKYPEEHQNQNLAPYDIGLVKLKIPLTFTIRVRSILLPKPDSVISKTQLDYNLVLTGWGQTGRDVVPQEDILRTVNVPVVSNRICENSIQQHFDWITLDSRQICTRPLDGSTAACVGDFGGPLIQYNENNRPVIIGIITWCMIPCNTETIPPVYARIPHFVKWIKKRIE